MKKLLKLLSLFLLFFAFGCASACPNKDINIYLEERVTTKIPPFDSFVNIVKATKLKMCSIDMRAMKPVCKHRFIYPNGSGFLIKKTKKGSYALTAAHVCNFKPKFFPVVKSFLFSYDIDRDRRYVTKIISFDKRSDICLVFVEGLTKRPVVKLANHSPRRGDKVYNIANPQKTTERGIVPLYEGRFLGVRTYLGVKSFIFTLFSNPGSSGSMILNNRFEAVSIISRGRFKLDFTIGSSLKAIKQLVSKTFLKKPIDKS